MPLTLPIDPERNEALLEAMEAHREALLYIRAALSRGQLEDAREAFRSLGEDAMIALWVAPSKGGPFTTREREQLRNDYR